jgi:hypothetical protein
MNFKALFVTTPVVWIILVSFFAAAALSRITRSVKKAENPEAAVNRKWVIVCIYLSFMTASAICALFVPGPQKILDIRYLYLGIISFVLFFLAWRFKKSFGIPFMSCFFLLFIMTFLFIQALIAFTGETEIAEVMVLSTRDDTMKLELRRNQAQNELVEMKGSYFAPVVKVVIFDDLLVFFGAKTWYRFEGIVSFKKEQGNPLLVQQEVHLFKRPPGISELLYSIVEYNDGRIPGIKTPQIEIVQKRAQELELYKVFVQNDGGVQVIDLH